jgi:hypothetical protein
LNLNFRSTFYNVLKRLANRCAICIEWERHIADWFSLLHLHGLVRDQRPLGLSYYKRFLRIIFYSRLRSIDVLSWGLFPNANWWLGFRISWTNWVIAEAEVRRKKWSEFSFKLILESDV